MNKILEQQTASLQSMDKKLEVDALVQKSQLLAMLKQEKELVEDGNDKHKDLVELKDISKMMFDELKSHTELFKKHLGEVEKSSLTTEEKNEENKQKEEQISLLRQISDKLSLAFKDGKEGKDNQLGGLGTVLGIGAALAPGILIAKFKAMFLGLRLLANLVPNGIVDLIKNGVGKLVAGIKAISQFGSRLFSIISSGVLNFGKTIKFFVGMFDSLGSFDKLKPLFSSITKGFNAVTKVFSSISSSIMMIAEKLGTISKVSSSISSGITKIANFGSKIISFFEVIGGKLGAFTTLFKSAVGVISRIAYPLLVIMSIWDSVKGFFKGFEEGGLIGGIKGAIKGLFNGLVFGFADLIKDMASWVFKAIGFDSISKMLDSFSFQKIFSKVVDAVFAIPQKLQDIIIAIPEAIGKVFSTIANIFTSIPSLFKEFVIDPLGDLFKQYIVDPLKKVFEPISNFFEKIKTQLLGFFENFGIPEIGFTIPVINKKVTIGPFYPFKANQQITQQLESSSTPNRSSISSKPTESGIAPSTTNNRVDVVADKEVLTQYAQEEAKKFGRSTPNREDRQAAMLRLRKERSSNTITENNTSSTNIRNNQSSSNEIDSTSRSSISRKESSIEDSSIRKSRSNASSISRNESSSNNVVSIQEVKREEEAYQKLNFFERLKVNVGAAKATDILAAKESAVAPIPPSATMGAAVSGASSANAEAAMIKQSAPILVNAPSTNVSNNTNQNIAVPKPVRTQDPSLTSYLRSPSRAW